MIGGGDTAMEEATFLSRFAKSVTIVHRRDTLRASKAMQERAFADPKIKFAWDSEVAEIHGEQKLSGLTLRNLKTGETLRAARHRPVHRHRPRPAHRALQGPARPGRRGLPQGATPLAPAPTCPASSPPATSSTTPTARRSPPPAPAAPPPWTPSATSPRCWTRAATPSPRRPPSDSPPSPHRTHQAEEPAVAGTAEERDRRLLRRGRPQERQARPGRLLGRVVRPVPPDRPVAGGHRRRARRRDHRSSSSTSTRTRPPPPSTA